MTDLTEQSPAEIDAQLYSLYGKAWTAQTLVANAFNNLHYTAGDKKHWVRGHGEWTMSDAEALAKTREVAASNGAAWTVKDAEKALARLEQAEAEVAAIRAQQKPLEAEYERRGRWNRAFLVTNGNGHVHSSMRCSTCNRGRYATLFQWMTDWSDKDEAEIVAAAGWRACTVCFPSAPVGTKTSLPTAMFSDEDKTKEEARKEREAAKAAREAKAKAAAPTASGEALEIRLEPYEGNYRGKPWTYYRLSETFRTERSAMIWATDKYYYAEPTGTTLEAIQIIAANLAEKHGKSVETVLAEIETKGKKKAGR